MIYLVDSIEYTRRGLGASSQGAAPIETALVRLREDGGVGRAVRCEVWALLPDEAGCDRLYDVRGATVEHLHVGTVRYCDTARQVQGRKLESARACALAAVAGDDVDPESSRKLICPVCDEVFRDAPGVGARLCMRCDGAYQQARKKSRQQPSPLWIMAWAVKRARFVRARRAKEPVAQDSAAWKALEGRA